MSETEDDISIRDLLHKQLMQCNEHRKLVMDFNESITAKNLELANRALKYKQALRDAEEALEEIALTNTQHGRIEALSKYRDRRAALDKPMEGK